MGFRSEIYQKALKIKNDAIKTANAEYEKKLSELRIKNQDFNAVEEGLLHLGPAIAIAAFSDDTDKLSEFRNMSEVLSAKHKQLLKDENIVKPDFFCKKCEDSGYFDGGYCDCVKDIAKTLVAEELSKTMPLGDCNFDNFDLNFYPDTVNEHGENPRKRAAAVLSLCKKFADDFPHSAKSLLLMGGAGLGKTHLSLSIVSAISQKGYSAVYGPAGTLFNSVEKEHFAYGGNTEKLDSLLECDLLVIDDLGTEFLSSFTSSLFYNIVNSRLLSGLPTVISTNLTIDEIEARYSARITSRFIGSYDLKVLIGSDIRQLKLLK